MFLRVTECIVTYIFHVCNIYKTARLLYQNQQSMRFKSIWVCLGVTLEISRAYIFHGLVKTGNKSQFKNSNLRSLNRENYTLPT